MVPIFNTVHVGLFMWNIIVVLEDNIWLTIGYIMEDGAPVEVLNSVV